MVQSHSMTSRRSHQTRHLRKEFLISVACGLVAYAPAHAQTAEPQPVQGLQDIIVTAQKRAENVQNVPATIAAFSTEMLENRQIKGLADLTTRVPSLQVGSTFGSNLITLRGISTNITSGFEDPSVAVHVNGVYQPRARSLNLALMDLERIEVLSGPQGTLYGRNATGGVVNYILRRPTNEMEAEVTGRVGNFDSYGVQGFISGPLNEKVGFRIAGLLDNRDKGHIKNLLAGAPKSTMGEDKVVGVRGLLSFEPTDALSIDVEGSFSHTRGSLQFTALEPSINPAYAALLAPQSFRPRQVYSDVDSQMNTKQYAASATISWDLSDDVQLKSISAYQRYKNFMAVDQDASGFLAQTIPSANRSRTYSEEINLNATSLDGRLKSVFGIFYFNDKVVQWTELYSNLFGGNNVRLFRGDFQQRAKSLAFFTDNTFSLTERLRILAGIRYNIDKKYATITIAGACDRLSQSRKDTAWTPRAGLQYDITDKVMAYATYQKGFKAGGFVAGACSNSYDPETIEGGEAGFKAEFADNRVRLNIAGYWYDYANLQVQRTLGTVGGYAVSNAAKSRIKGIEGNMDAQITDALKLDVAAMVQSAKYTDYTNCNQQVFFGACGAGDTRSGPARLQQLRGNRLNRAAPWSINVGLEYGMDVASGKLTLRGESFWSGKIQYDEFNTPILAQRAYDLQNAFLTFTPADDRYTVRAFAKNIGNVNYKSGAFFEGFLAQNVAFWNLPRTYGAEATFRF